MSKHPIPLQNARPGRRPSPEEEKDWKFAPTEMPKAPNLGPDANNEWNRIEKYLVALNRVAAVDRQSLTAYCTQWGMFASIMRTELSNPSCDLFVDGPNCEVIHPLLPPLVRSAKQTIHYAGLFGLTARTRDLDGDHGNRKSSALKRLMGNQRKIANSKLAPSVVPMLPEWDDGDMNPPFWMNTRAKEEFNALGEELSKLDLFTPLDVVPLSIGCSLFDLYLRAIDQIDGQFYTEVTNRDGAVTSLKEHPLFRVTYEVLQTIEHIWKDYGQSPRFRKLFKGEKKQEQKEIPIIFKGKFA